jgi:integrase
MADDILERALAALHGGKARRWEVEVNGHRVNVPDHPDPDTNYRQMTETMARLEALPPKAAAIDPTKPLVAVLTIRDAAAKHLSDLRAQKRQPRTLMDSAHALRLLAELLGEDKPVAEITTEDMREIRDNIARLPTNASKRKEFKGLNVKGAILLASAKNIPGPADRTMEKHRSRLSKFFNDLVKHDKIDRNPIRGVRFGSDCEEEEPGRRPFTDEELRNIFEPVRFKAWASKAPHRWFGPMLGLYSGARVNEIAQLLAEDIQQDEGVWGFRVRPSKSKGKSVKNDASKRFVPFAQPILDAGILAYVDDLKDYGHARLFPNLPRKEDGGFGAYLSKQFSAYLKKECGITEPGLGFHGFRHTFATRLSRKRVGLEEIAPITGHVRNENVLRDAYIDTVLPADMVETLAKFVPPVSLLPYTSGQFRHAFRKAEINRPPSKRAKEGGVKAAKE